MSRIKTLRNKKAALFGQMSALRDRLADDALAAEVRTTLRAEFAAHEATMAGIAEDLAAEERLQDIERSMPVAAEPAAPRVEVGADRTTLAPARLGDWGRQLQAVAAFATSGGHVSAGDLALLRPMMAGPTGLNTDVGSEGGFLVTQERSSGILQRMYTTGAILSRLTPMPIGAGANGTRIPAIDETSRADNSRYGGIVSGWLGQGNTLTAGKPKFREMDLRLRKVGAFVYATSEQLADAVALEGWIGRYLPLELTFRVEDATLNGTGANQPQGALNSGAVISITRNTASRVLYEDVAGMWARMWAPSRRTAVWYVDQSVESQLEQLNIAIGTAGVLAPIYRAAGSVPGQDVATLYGRPIVPVEYLAALGTAGDIVLFDPQEYTLIDKGGVDQAVSIHVAFLTDESVFRFTYRVDGQLSWNAPLTPKSAGATLSPILALTT